MVYAEWVDSAVTVGWKRPDSADYGVSHCETLGFLVLKNRSEVRIAMQVSDSGAVSEVMCIPRSCIKRLVKVTV